MMPEAIRNLPTTEVKLTLYGKEQLVRAHRVVGMVHFLKGTLDARGMVRILRYGQTALVKSTCAGGA